MGLRNQIFCRGRIYSTLFLIIILIAACSSKEENLELFSAEAFAYSMESGWELNATCRAKGFEQHELNDNFTAKLSYTVDLKTPDGKLFEVIDEGLIDQTNSEKIIDLAINSQIQFDSSYSPGTYTVIFKVTDDYSQKKATLEKQFDLIKD